MIFLIISIFLAYKTFYPIYIAEEIIIPYGIHPFDICSQNPILWKYIKIIFIISFFISNIFFSNFIYIRILSKFKFFQNSKEKINNNKSNKKGINNYSNLNLLIGKENNKKIFLPESGLYQNFLITRNNRIWKNKFCYVSFHKTIFRV